MPPGRESPQWVCCQMIQDRCWADWRRWMSAVSGLLINLLVDGDGYKVQYCTHPCQLSSSRSRSRSRRGSAAEAERLSKPATKEKRGLAARLAGCFDDDSRGINWFRRALGLGFICCFSCFWFLIIHHHIIIVSRRRIIMGDLDGIRPR